MVYNRDCALVMKMGPSAGSLLLSPVPHLTGFLWPFRGGMRNDPDIGRSILDWLSSYAPMKSKPQHHPPSPLLLGKPRAFDCLLCPGSGEFDLCLRGVGKIEPEESGLK